MAFKRKVRRARRRRSTSFAAARPRRRRIGAVKKKRSRSRKSSGGTGFAMTPVNIAVAVGGALLANAYVEKLPIADARYRYAAGAVAGYILTNKVPKQFKPALIGATIACAGKAALAFAPQLLSFTGSGGGNPAKLSMGRMTYGQQQQVLHAARMGGAPNAVITGNTNVITGTRRLLNGRYIYV